jgi:transposase
LEPPENPVRFKLSRRVWLITTLSPGSGEKMSEHSVPAGEVSGLLRRFAELKRKAAARTGRDFPIIVIQEAGLDGFWIHRVLQSEGIESHVVDAASILTSRRRRRAKTDRIDGETLVRTLMAFKRGEPRVCSMARAPTPQEEDRRRVCRERRTLVGERVRHVNRIKGLLFAQGVFGYEPLRKGRRERLEDLRTGDGRPLPVHLKAQIIRELGWLQTMSRYCAGMALRQRSKPLTDARPPSESGKRTRSILTRHIQRKSAILTVPEGLAAVNTVTETVSSIDCDGVDGPLAPLRLEPLSPARRALPRQFGPRIRGSHPARIRWSAGLPRAASPPLMRRRLRRAAPAR